MDGSSASWAIGSTWDTSRDSIGRDSDEEELKKLEKRLQKTVRSYKKAFQKLLQNHPSSKSAIKNKAIKRFKKIKEVQSEALMQIGTEIRSYERKIVDEKSNIKNMRQPTSKGVKTNSE